MEILIAAFVIGAIAWLFVRGKSQSSKLITNTRKKTKNDDYHVWLSIIKERKSNIREFDLFGTQAAIAWNDGDDEVVIICITAFRNGAPITNKWDHFDYNIREKYWAGIQPKGAPARIREELKSIGLI